MNKITLIGNLVHDPELKTVGEDLSKCRFSIAVNRRKQKDKEQEVDYFDIIAWRGQADYCAQWLKKGTKVAVVGRLEIRDYEGKDGVKRKAIEVQAEEIEKLSFDNNKGEQKQVTLTPIADDSCPF